MYANPYVHSDDCDMDTEYQAFGCSVSCKTQNPAGQDETSTDRAIAWLYKVAATLKEKGRVYGNSIDNPVGIFSRGTKDEGLAARIDDKLARIKAADPSDSEDSVEDLVGYIALWKGSK